MFFDEVIAKECGERLYRGQYVDENQAQKLRKIKSPGLIVLISNEPTHEIKERLIKMKRTNNREKKDEEIKRINRIIEKIETCIMYAVSDEAEIPRRSILPKMGMPFSNMEMPWQCHLSKNIADLKFS